MQPDATVSYLGVFCLVIPVSARAVEWVEANVSDAVTYSDRGVLIETTDVDAIIEAMIKDGLELPFFRRKKDAERANQN